ncbi:histidine kinase dimerization/phospho-acceptor domain-containing protein, partial [Pantoea endophytica]
DQSGALRGMVSDLITLVTLKTGLRFSFETVDTSQELVNRVNSADFDMFASLTPSAQREQQILFTRPYLRSTFALTRRVGNNDIHSLPDLRGKRLAMVANTSDENMVHARYPEIEIVPVQNITEMMAKVDKGQADAGVDILVMVDYQIKTHFQNKLKMVSAIGSSPAWVSFGVGRADPELRSILDKVLLSIPPVEIEELANRWRPSDLIVYDSFWQRYQAVLIASIIFFVLLMLMVIGWSLYQRQIIRRKAELRRELNVQLAQLQALVTSMPFPVSLRDKDGRLTYCNQRYLVETGVIYEEALGKTMPEHPGLRTPEQAAFYHNQLIDVVKTGVPIVEDRRYDLWDNPDSSIGVTVYQWIQPFNDSDGNVVGVIAGWMDISEREALFAELREAKERAEDSSRAKSVFLSTMSHEIRTPMNAIIGMLDMALKKGRSGEQDLQALEVAYDSAESLVGLIGDILDISRIEGGQLEYHPEAVHPGKLIDNLMKVFQGLAIDKNITLTRHIPEDGLEQVLADPLRIKQVLSNLLSNAIKFTDQGGVSLTLTQQKDVAADHVYLVIEVQDSGIGIDEKQQAALFKP